MCKCVSIELESGGFNRIVCGTVSVAVYTEGPGQTVKAGRGGAWER